MAKSSGGKSSGGKGTGGTGSTGSTGSTSGTGGKGGKGKGGGPVIRPLYGVWIDDVLKTSNVSEMKAVLQEARKHFPPPVPLYGVWINQCIERGASRQELEQLLEQARATANSDLQGAIKKLEQHLGKK